MRQQMAQQQLEEKELEKELEEELLQEDKNVNMLDYVKNVNESQRYIYCYYSNSLNQS